MTDTYRQEDADALDEQQGEATEPTGRAYDGRDKRHGNVAQSAAEANDDDQATALREAEADGVTTPDN